jgi:hypothetical protein
MALNVGKRKGTNDQKPNLSTSRPVYFTLRYRSELEGGHFCFYLEELKTDRHWNLRVTFQFELL